MKKKKSDKSRDIETIELKPFKITDEYQEEAENFSSFTPSYKIKNKIGILSTPAKSIIKKDDLQKAAKKEDPFRDLNCQLNHSH